MPVIKCRKIRFYSHLDEAMFFDALKRMSAVRKIEGRGSDLDLSVPSRLSEKALRDLLGLFFRYRVDMRHLAPFLTEKNRPWFHSPETYWFKKVFPTA
jgi:hypothetical protein